MGLKKRLRSGVTAWVHRKRSIAGGQKLVKVKEQKTKLGERCPKKRLGGGVSLTITAFRKLVKNKSKEKKSATRRVNTKYQEQIGNISPLPNTAKQGSNSGRGLNTIVEGPGVL